MLVLLWGLECHCYLHLLSMPVLLVPSCSFLPTVYPNGSVSHLHLIGPIILCLNWHPENVLLGDSLEIQLLNCQLNLPNLYLFRIICIVTCNMHPAQFNPSHPRAPNGESRQGDERTIKWVKTLECWSDFLAQLLWHWEGGLLTYTPHSYRPAGYRYPIFSFCSLSGYCNRVTTGRPWSALTCYVC